MGLLVIKRKVDEGAQLFDAKGRRLGRVFPVRMECGAVRLGFDLAADVRLWRDEVVEARAKESAAAGMACGTAADEDAAAKG